MTGVMAGVFLSGGSDPKYQAYIDLFNSTFTFTQDDPNPCLYLSNVASTVIDGVTFNVRLSLQFEYGVSPNPASTYALGLTPYPPTTPPITQLPSFGRVLATNDDYSNCRVDVVGPFSASGGSVFGYVDARDATFQITSAS
jgi:hypothetical protein